MTNQAFSSNQATLHLSADCEQCFGLCCVALPYGKSSDFAFDKSSGTPVPISVPITAVVSIHSCDRRGSRAAQSTIVSGLVRNYHKLHMRAGIGVIIPNLLPRCSIACLS